MRTRSYYRKKNIINKSLRYNYMQLLKDNYYKNKLIMNTIFVYFTWITIHYISTHLYSHYCTKLSLWGYIMSPIIVTTPICRGLSWIIYTGSDKIFNMWNLLGSFILNYISS